MRKRGTATLAKRKSLELDSLCRAYTEESVRAIAGIMRNGIADADRIKAAVSLLDRGHGKPKETMNVAGQTDIQITIRTILEGHIKPEPKVIEGKVFNADD